MPEAAADSLFSLTVKIPPDTDSPDASADSAPAPSLRFHVMVNPVEPSATLVWSRKMTGVSLRLPESQLGA